MLVLLQAFCFHLLPSFLCLSPGFFLGVWKFWSALLHGMMRMILEFRHEWYWNESNGQKVSKLTQNSIMLLQVFLKEGSLDLIWCVLWKQHGNSILSVFVSGIPVSRPIIFSLYLLYIVLKKSQHRYGSNFGQIYLTQRFYSYLKVMIIQSWDFSYLSRITYFKSGKVRLTNLQIWSVMIHTHVL